MHKRPCVYYSRNAADCQVASDGPGLLTIEVRGGELKVTRKNEKNGLKL